MFKSKKLECMKDVVTLAREVGDVKMKQCTTHSGKTHTTFVCRIPRDIMPDVQADVTANGGQCIYPATSTFILGEEVSDTHYVALGVWAGG